MLPIPRTGQLLRLTAAVVASVVSTFPSSAEAQGRRTAPSGQEIAEKAKSATLVRSKALYRQHRGKRFSFTPADIDPSSPIEPGVVGGVLEHDFAFREDGLTQGRYNMFLAKIDGEWRVYAESNGEIATSYKVHLALSKLLDARHGSQNSRGMERSALLDPRKPGISFVSFRPVRSGDLSARSVKRCRYAADSRSARRESALLWALVPYTVCYYACVAATGWWLPCGESCEARYPF
ncbi:MAG: hypothetical protein ABR499_15565 [Gemmatimonadaceae bacterium]